MVVVSEDAGVGVDAVVDLVAIQEQADEIREG